MARYFFDIQDGAQSVHDEDGSDCDSSEAACTAAARVAAELGQDRVAKGDTSAVVVQVRNEHGQRVCTVRASLQIERHDPAYEGPHPWSA